MRLTVFAGVLLAGIAAPLAAQAQGVPGGAAHGFHEGNRIAGPVGAVVGTAVGGVIGGVEGVFGINHAHRTAYSSYGEDAPPPAARKVRRHKTYSHRTRQHRKPAPGYVNG
ncbi:MAG: hypothetical protein WCE79_03970 [Xanthobacteraceae bacterium]